MRRVLPWICGYSRTHNRHGRAQADQTAAIKASIAAPSGDYRADVRDVEAGSDRTGYQRLDVQRGYSKEKDGSLRFCIDYRRLNEASRKDLYPLPRIDSSQDAMAEACWFSTFDLRAGYHQVNMDPSSAEKNHVYHL